MKTFDVSRMYHTVLKSGQIRKMTVFFIFLHRSFHTGSDDQGIHFRFQINCQIVAVHQLCDLGQNPVLLCRCLITLPSHIHIEIVMSFSLKTVKPELSIAMR